ncbi:natural resistance-associated macrophage protein [Caldicellulosiruptor hydrothermalis 108]|uniref:Natural resistance-associated macrophage protein n=1 Tax=Caldicellulosiruptor hydrothermalis (strain DSM 18901 / VKM B-2411 / 108) TaxID=632292 RepID=E4Q7S9_CALH1|nr:Nramp family divalent metal transporter [Caldicellulosiruptor hydrothermalis]ADQ06719.1 natural resistance-associated macrophage protein [Caldicellulosiruptor hydrothermalis 108]
MKNAREIIKYIGPGLLVTVGFIDPGNWASNVAAGSSFGLKLLWVVLLSTIILIVLQHNAAHLGIATGLCLAEATSIYLNKSLATVALSSAMLATVSTAMAEILGAAIALEMLFKIPIKLGCLIILPFTIFFLFSNSYKKVERWIIAFVSLIGLSFLIELFLVKVPVKDVVFGWITPSVPSGSLVVVLSILGAVVMPHNLFLHSEIIQSRQWNTQDEKVIKHQLKFEFVDTLFSMFIGFLINSSMIIIAHATFYTKGILVESLPQAQQMLKPILGSFSATIFAFALLLSGISSSITAAYTGGTIMAGFYRRPYNIEELPTKIGITIPLVLASIIILFISNPFKALIISQMLLSMQLPITIILQIYLTSSKKVMGKFANSLVDKVILGIVAALVIGLDVFLLIASL